MARVTYGNGVRLVRLGTVKLGYNKVSRPANNVRYSRDNLCCNVVWDQQFNIVLFIIFISVNSLQPSFTVFNIMY